MGFSEIRDIYNSKPPAAGAAGGFIVLATEAAEPAENLPDGATTGVAVGVARENKHLADLLNQYLSREDKWIVTVL